VIPRLPHRLGFVVDHRWVARHASEYLDAELDPDECRRVERHAEDCPECRELLRSLRALIAALGTIGTGEPEVVAAAVLTSIHSRLSELSQDSP
jgi:anti-sigma factor RsiW